MNTLRHIMCMMVVSLLAATTLWSNSTYPSHFSNDRDLFIKELEQFMTGKKRKPLLDIFQKFERAYESGAFSEKQISMLIEVSNSMLDRKLAAEPFFQQYLECLLILNSKKEDKQWDSWQSTWGVMVADANHYSSKLLKQTLSFSLHFFTTSMLTEGKSSIVWRVDKGAIWILKDNQPFLKFEAIKLEGLGKTNKLVIEKASGIFSPIKKQFLGSTGETNWQRLGKEQIVVELQAYSIQVKKNKYIADQALLHFPDRWPDQAVKGTFVDRLLQNPDPAKTIYPQFTASEKVWIKNEEEGIQLHGFYQLQGLKEKMVSKADQLAFMIKNSSDGETKFRAYSESFTIKSECIISPGAMLSISCYIKDSLYHPMVQMRYEVKRGYLHVQRNCKQAEGRRDFIDSYTRMNIGADKIEWWLKQDSLLLSPKNLAVEQGSADVVISSPQFFDVRQYRKLQGAASRNPVATLNWLAKEKASRIFSATEFAQQLNPNLSAGQIAPLLEDLCSKGFIDWDRSEEVIKVLDKALHFVAADQEQSDFDQVRLVSSHHQANARFQFGDHQWQTDGVKLLEFSGPRQVAAKPLEGQVTLLSNRGMQFDGRLFSGLGVFEGQGMRFEYEPFVIQLDSVAYFDVFLNEEGAQESNSKTPSGLSIGSRLENLSGVLYIDRADNKSGRDTSSYYPAFSSQKEAYVYYTQADTNYQKANFFFALDPFKLKGLGHISGSQMVFPGTMTSADIFPAFRETLLLQEDQSLGYQHHTPESGYSLYQQRGQFKGQILLSNDGFFGKGKFSYRWAEVVSQDIYFQPNRLRCSAEKFELPEVRDEAVQIPAVVGKTVDIDWKPYRDSMYVRSAEQAFELFSKNGYTHQGLLILTPDGLHGRGNAKWPAGAVSADLLSFGAYSIKADSCNLSIQTQGIVKELALATENVKADLDFDKQMGFIRARLDTVTTSLPYNKYRTSMNSYDWDMKNESVHFHPGENRLGYFWCTDKKQEGIQFDGANADYDLKSSILKIGGVERIQLADAWLYPDSGQVAILKDGKIERLQKARLVMDTLNRYHEIVNVSADIFGKNSLTASGDYVYKLDQQEQKVHFVLIEAERIGKGKKKNRQVITKATTEIQEKDPFYLGKKINFKGKVNLQSNWTGLQFEGYARLDDPRLPNTRWFEVNYKGNKKQPILQLPNEILDPQNQQLSTGLYLSSETGEIYPQILGYTHHKGDRPLSEITGYLRYDIAADAFLLGDSMRVHHKTSRGTLFRVEQQGKGYTYEGALEVGSELSTILTKVAGSIQTNKNNNIHTQATVMARLDFPLPDKLWKAIASDFKTHSFDADPINYQTNSDLYEKALFYFIDNSKQLKQTISGMKSGSRYVPKELGKASLFFSHIDLSWDSEQRAFINNKGKIGLFSLGDQPLHRWFDGFLKIQKPLTGGDRTQLYLKSPSGFYYFFQFRNGILGISSNNPTIGEVFSGLKEKEKIQKTLAEGEEEIEIQWLAPTQVQQFLSGLND